MGIFFVPQTVADHVPGYGGLIVYGTVALLLVPVALVFAKLGSVFEQEGGPYLYARAAFGETAAFAVGWLTFLSALFSTATVVVGLIEAVAAALDVHSRGARALAALALLGMLGALLARGLRLSAWAWSIATVVKLVPLFALLAVALISAAGSAAPSPHDAPIALPGLLAAALPVVFALQGFEVVPLPAAQVERPRRSVPYATVASLVLPALLYLALHAACVRALPDLGAHSLPLADAGRAYGGVHLYRAMVAATNVSALGITIGMLAMTPRYLAVLGHDTALGRRLGEQSARAVPLRALAVTLAVVSMAVTSSFAWGSIADLFALSSICVIIQYGVTAASLVRLALRRHGGLAPLDAWAAPFVLLACGLIAVGATRFEMLTVVVMFGVGLVLRAFHTRLQERRARSCAC